MTQSLRFRSTCIYGVRFALSVYMRIDMWVGVVCISSYAGCGTSVLRNKKLIIGCSGLNI